MSGIGPTTDPRGEVFPAIFVGPSHKISISGSNQTATVAQTTTLVRLVSDTDCFIDIGAAADATVQTKYLPAKVVDYFACNPGDKVAVTGTSGNLYITEGL